MCCIKTSALDQNVLNSQNMTLALIAQITVQSQIYWRTTAGCTLTAGTWIEFNSLQKYTSNTQRCTSASLLIIISVNKHRQVGQVFQSVVSLTCPLCQVWRANHAYLPRQTCAHHRTRQSCRAIINRTTQNTGHSTPPRASTTTSTAPGRRTHRYLTADRYPVLCFR